jgi:hypothetical protein
MKYYLGGLLLLISSLGSYAQELFVYTEPASNMPAHSLGLRVTNNLMDEAHLGQTTYQMLPELMWGVNKNLMLHADGFFSNANATFEPLGAGVYAKYRFYTHDDVHRHFRMAAYGRASFNNGHVHYQEIETNGINTGYEAGLIATQLLHKQAISASASYEQIMDNGQNNKLHDGAATQAINYTLSTGRLILPKSYKTYKQTNLNLMLELLGQQLPQNGLYYVDIAPSVQLIFSSQTRVDLGYRAQLSGNMERMTKSAVLIRFEHLLFNVLH